MKKSVILTLMMLCSIMLIVSCDDSDKQFVPIPNKDSNSLVIDTVPLDGPEVPETDTLPEMQDYDVYFDKKIPLTIDENMLYVWLPKDTYKALQEKRVNEGKEKVVYYQHHYSKIILYGDSVIDEEIYEYKNFVETFIYKDEIAYCDSCIVVAPVYRDEKGEIYPIQCMIYVALEQDSDIDILKEMAEKYDAYISKISNDSYWLYCCGTNRKLSPLSVCNYLIESGKFKLVDIASLTPTEKA